VFEFLAIMRSAPSLPLLLRPVQHLLVRAAVDLTPDSQPGRSGVPSDASSGHTCMFNAAQLLSAPVHFSGPREKPILFCRLSTRAAAHKHGVPLVVQSDASVRHAVVSEEETGCCK
jgi:hypothetical protein